MFSTKSLMMASPEDKTIIKYMVYGCRETKRDCSFGTWRFEKVVQNFGFAFV